MPMRRRDAFRHLLGLPVGVASASGVGLWGKLAGWYEAWRRRRGGLDTTTHAVWNNYFEEYTPAAASRAPAPPPGSRLPARGRRHTLT